MLTAGEVAAIETALREAERGVELVEAAARDSRNLLAWIGLPDETARRAQDRAEERRANLERMRARRVELFELPTYDHEAALALVEYLRKMAADAPAIAAGFRSAVENERPLMFAGNVLEGTLEDLGLTPAGDGSGGRRVPTIVWWAVAGIVALAVLPPLAAAAVTAAMRRGS